jgi:septal ring factor EnvC (AmiA/AmiB activator)
MKTNNYLSGLILISGSLFAICSCDNAQKHQETAFTKADSLTETYLALQDSMLQAWNTMIHDDNRKIKAMRNLLHELSVSRPEKQEDLSVFEERLNGLLASRYDEKTMSDTEVVTEYDFASNALVTELISLAESENQFAYNTTMQKLVDDIRAADQRVMNYREEYDEIAARYNRFVERNRPMLKDLDHDSGLETRPLFEMAAE